LTNDIGLYIDDGREAIVVKDCSPEALGEGVRRALSLSAQEKARTREHA
jgi:hypothetical protein